MSSNTWTHMRCFTAVRLQSPKSRAKARTTGTDSRSTASACASIGLIRGAGARAGVSIKPATPAEALREVLPLVDLVLVMSVEPGFGGQSFIPGSLDKIRALRAMIREQGLGTIVEVDGGISARNAREVFDAGADALVAGSAVFGAEDPEAEIARILAV